MSIVFPSHIANTSDDLVVRIFSININPGVPIVHRKNSKFVDKVDPETEKPIIGEDGEPEQVELLGEVTGYTKTINCNVWLHYFTGYETTEVDSRLEVAVNGLSMEDIGADLYETLYKRIKEMPEFAEAVDA